MRKCKKCLIDKEETHFSFRNKNTGSLQSYCKECQKLERKEHYGKNKSYFLHRNRKSRARKTKYLIDLRNSTPCADCNKQYPYYIMDFDHIENKIRPVTQMICYSWRLLKSEIKKCEIVCANCHAARTWKRRKAHVSQLEEDLV